MTEPWNLTEAQRRQFREAHAEAKERAMASELAVADAADAFSSVREEIADYRSMAAMRAESRENEGLDAQMMWGRVDAYDALLGFMNGDERFTGIASPQPQAPPSPGASFEVRSEEAARVREFIHPVETGEPWRGAAEAEWDGSR